jgi:hypothetical protein
MAKKAEAVEKTEVAPQPKIAKKEKIQQPLEPVWEIKDRLYNLVDRLGKPIVYSLASKHSAKFPLLYFDEKLGYQRELRYATNQKSVFVDEQKGQSTLGRIVFRDGRLYVPKEQQNLQKLLSLYHPLRNKYFSEDKPREQAMNEVEYINYEIEALLAAKEMGIEGLEAILRVEFGERVDLLSSSELKRDGLVFAKRNPILFLQLANDENVELRNIGVKAVQQGIISLSQDQRTFSYGETGRKLMTVPFDEHPYSALAVFFKTDEGMDVYKHIIKKL